MRIYFPLYPVYICLTKQASPQRGDFPTVSEVINVLRQNMINVTLKARAVKIFMYTLRKYGNSLLNKCFLIKFNQ